MLKSIIDIIVAIINFKTLHIWHSHMLNFNIVNINLVISIEILHYKKRLLLYILNRLLVIRSILHWTIVVWVAWHALLLKTIILPSCLVINKSTLLLLCFRWRKYCHFLYWTHILLPWHIIKREFRNRILVSILV